MSKTILWPRSISTQMVTIVILCMATTISVIMFLLVAFRPYIPPLPDGPWPNSLAIETGLTALQHVPEPERKKLAQMISTPDLRFVVGERASCKTIPTRMPTEDLRRILQGKHPEFIVEAYSCAADSSGMTTSTLVINNGYYAVQAHDGVNFHWPQIMRLTMPLIVAFASVFLMVVALSVWSVRRINRPLSFLAEHVEAFGQDITPMPLEDTGPLEIQRLARAYNRMQARIVRYVEERTRMLMSIGHDLRTPLTRLAMRVELGAEMLSPDTVRREVILMTRMLNGTLSYLQDQNDLEPEETTDLDSLIESLCSGFSDMGKPVSYTPVGQMVCQCQPIALSRAINNLIENGLKYGGSVSVILQNNSEKAVILVKDNGPGIPEHERDNMLLPFTRLDQARTSHGGLGLGLSIVQQVVERHHGLLELMDNKPSGLVVRITLPLEKNYSLFKKK